MKIKHFGGIEYVNNIEEFANVLSQKYGANVNEFWITEDEKENPCLAILINKELANVTYFPDEESLGFQAAGSVDNSDMDEFVVFYTNTPDEEIEVSNEFIITYDEAINIAKEFFDKHDMPENVEWIEN
ncbi:MAG: hypothetical protein K5884_04370 [Ruminococcus sp.]|nr:hypothetical protein [Ruminococcus sp.]